MSWNRLIKVKDASAKEQNIVFVTLFNIVFLKSSFWNQVTR